MMIQEPTRLSESLLWELQKRAYEEFGPEAWTLQGVPSHITSNPLIARQYCALIIGYLRDIYEQLDLNSSVYLFDLGAGTGKLAYLILKKLLPTVKKLFPGVQLCYVMTDITDKNFRFWENHPYFKYFYDEEVLDYCYFHHADLQAPLTLKKSGVILNQTKNPLVLICNYFFDTIPQDLFRMQEGELYEGKIALSTEKEGISIDDPGLIPYLDFTFSYYPATERDTYPDEPDLHYLLLDYQQLIQDAAFVFPTEPIRTIARFSHMSNGRLLLLAGDQGRATEDQVKRWKELKIAIHGSFSLEVNYHALSCYFDQRGGVGLLDPLSDPFFINFTGVLGENTLNTELAFADHPQAFSSADYFRLTTHPGRTLDELLLQIKLGAFDPSLFYEFYDKISHFSVNATPDERERLIRTIDAVWNNFFPLSQEESHFVLNLGVLLFHLKQYMGAKKLFTHAVQLGGDRALLDDYIRKCDMLLSLGEGSS